MLSRWCKEAREGLFTVSGGKLGLDAKQVAELKRLRQVEQDRVLKEELTLQVGTPRHTFSSASQSTKPWPEAPEVVKPNNKTSIRKETV